MDAIAKLRVLFEADASALDGALGKTGKEVEGLGGKLGGLNDKAMGMSKAVGVGILGAGAGIAAFGGMAVSAASDIAESQNKVNVVFGESAGKIDDLAATAASKLGQTKAEVLNAAGGIGNLLTAMGQSKDSAADMSVQMVKLASDLGSFNNASSTEVLEAMQAAMAGETDGMKKYGVAITEATLKQAAMAAGLGDNVQALSAAEKQQLSLKIMMEQTTAAQGDFANTSDGLANGMKIIKASMSDAVAAIGEGLLPAVQKAGQAFAEFLQSEKFEEFKGKLIDVFAAIGDKLASVDFGAIADTVINVVTKIGDIFSWLADNPAIAKIVLAIGGLVAAFAPVMMIIGPIIPVVMSVVGAITGLLAPIGAAVAAAGGFTAVLGTLAAILTGPVAIAIGVVIAAYALWQAKGDEIKAAVADLVAAIGAKWEEIKAWTGAAFDFIGAYLTLKWNEFTTSIDTALNAIWAAVTTAWEGVKTAINDALEAIADNLRLKWDAFLRQISEKLDAILDKTSKAWEAVKKAIDDAMVAVEAALTAAWDRVKGIVDAAWTAIGDGIDARLAWIQQTIDKVLSWIEDKTGRSMEAVRNIFDHAMTAVRDIVGAVISLLQGDWAGALDGAKEAAYHVTEAIQGYFKFMVEGVRRWLDLVVSTITGWADKIGAEAGKIGQFIMEGIGRGVEAFKGALKAKLQAIIDLLPQWIKDFLGIHSPSQVMADEVGRPMAEGIIAGLDSGLRGRAIEPIIRLIGELGALPVRVTTSVGATLAAGILAGVVQALGGTPGGAQGSGGLMGAIALALGGGMAGRPQQKMQGRSPFERTVPFPFGGGPMRIPTNTQRVGEVGDVVARWNTSGRGGHVAASRSNYWQVFVQRFGVPTESSARKVAERLGIPLPAWLEQMYAASGVTPLDVSVDGQTGAVGGRLGDLGAIPAAVQAAGAAIASIAPAATQMVAALSAAVAVGGTALEPAIRELAVAISNQAAIIGGINIVPAPILEPVIPIQPGAPRTEPLPFGGANVENATVNVESATLETPPIDARVTVTTTPTITIGTRTIEVLTTMIEERLADSFLLGTAGV